MGKVVQIKREFSAVLLPDGNKYNAGQQMTLTDAEYATLAPSTSRAVTLVDGSVADPARPLTSMPASLSQAVSKAYADAVYGAGRTGPAGPSGPSGPSGAWAQAAFTVPSDEWVFDHNLGYPPVVMLFDASGGEIAGRVIENTETRSVAQFYLPVTGRMIVS